MFLSTSRCQVLEQFDFVSSRSFHHGEANLGARNAGDFLGYFAFLMRGMRVFKPKQVMPKGE
jgi:hypothetical protein